MKDFERSSHGKHSSELASPTKGIWNTPENTDMELRDPSIPETMAETEKLVCAASGIRSERNAGRILAQLEAMQLWGSEDEGSERAVAAFEMLTELKPANALESMLTVQMVGAHEAALMFLKRATIEGQTLQGSDANVLRATRLMRLFNEQLEAMAKLKGKAGQQKVTVEHVHVYRGGQAIVGPVPPLSEK
jgi:hypothetical protein